MEYFEIIMTGVRRQVLDKLLLETFRITHEYVKSSHFHNPSTNQDVSFEDFAKSNGEWRYLGSSHISLTQLAIGEIILENVVIVLSFNHEIGQVVINFPEENLLGRHRILDKNLAKKLIETIISLKKDLNVDKICFGYEPALDPDMCLIEFGDVPVDIEMVIDKLY